MAFLPSFHLSCPKSVRPWVPPTPSLEEQNLLPGCARGQASEERKVHTPLWPRQRPQKPSCSFDLQWCCVCCFGVPDFDSVVSLTRCPHLELSFDEKVVGTQACLWGFGVFVLEKHQANEQGQEIWIPVAWANLGPKKPSACDHRLHPPNVAVPSGFPSLTHTPS